MVGNGGDTVFVHVTEQIEADSAAVTRHVYKMYIRKWTLNDVSQLQNLNPRSTSEVVYCYVVVTGLTQLDV